MVDVIILAGEQQIKGLEEAGNKALCLINRKMMIEYVIDAIKEADGIKTIVVVGPRGKLSEYLNDKVDAVIESVGNAIENVLAGIEYLNSEENILICTCDIPMITTEAINDFIEKSQELNADLCYPIVEKKINDDKYPDMERTYVRIKEGKFTGGNIFYVNPRIVKDGFRLAEKLIKERKNPLKMARLLGLRIMVQLMLGNLAISVIERRFSRITGIKARAVVTSFPEIGQDVDKTGDLNMASHYLAGSSMSSK